MQDIRSERTNKEGKACYMGRIKLLNFINVLTLAKYPYIGHSGLMARVRCDCQDSDKVLKLFGEKSVAARRAYRQFVNKGVDQGKRADLTGSGLIRSVGEWVAVKALRAARVFEKGDERILGNGNLRQDPSK